MRHKNRRRPETPAEIRAENVNFWTRTAERYERMAQYDKRPGIRLWAAREARHARFVEARRQQEDAA